MYFEPEQHQYRLSGIWKHTMCLIANNLPFVDKCRRNHKKKYLRDHVPEIEACGKILTQLDLRHVSKILIVCSKNNTYYDRYCKNSRKCVLKNHTTSAIQNDTLNSKACFKIPHKRAQSAS